MLEISGLARLRLATVGRLILSFRRTSEQARTRIIPDLGLRSGGQRKWSTVESGRDRALLRLLKVGAKFEYALLFVVDKARKKFGTMGQGMFTSG